MVEIIGLVLLLIVAGIVGWVLVTLSSINSTLKAIHDELWRIRREELKPMRKRAISGEEGQGD